MNSDRGHYGYHRIDIFAKTIEKPFVSVTEAIQENGRKIVHNVVVSDLNDFLILAYVVNYISAIIKHQENKQIPENGNENAPIELYSSNIIEACTNSL